MTKTIALFKVRWVCQMHARRVAVRVRWGAVSGAISYMAWYGR